MDDGNLLSFFNSNFFSAAFGAAFGALTAAWLGRQSENRRLLLDEIAACNVAIGQCAAVANVYIAIKRQRVRPMNTNYVAQCQAVLQAATAAPGDGPAVLEFHYDLQSMTPPWTSIEALNHIISNRIMSAYEPASLAASLTQAVHNQLHVTEKRNELVGKFPAYSDDEKIARYFGVPLPTGGTDRSYPDLMQGLVLYTDDCIYFATLLADILSAHGSHLAFELGSSAPRIKKSDFSDVVRDGLMPDPKEYAAFEKQYRPKKPDMVVTM